MDYTVTGTVIDTEYASTSCYGNPAYWITLELEDGDTVRLRTSDNVMFAYACTNPEFKAEPHVYTLTRSGRIRYAKPVTNAR